MFQNLYKILLRINCKKIDLNTTKIINSFVRYLEIIPCEYFKKIYICQ